MALYRHVADKADLLDGMVERRLTELPPHAPELSWPERLSSTAREVRHCAQCHPRVFPLLLQRPATTPGGFGITSTLPSGRLVWIRAT
jgi:AcrR family transcriptional regulator